MVNVDGKTVVITGSTGTGKTRFSLKLAQEIILGSKGNEENHSVLYTTPYMNMDYLNKGVMTLLEDNTKEEKDIFHDRFNVLTVQSKGATTEDLLESIESLIISKRKAGIDIKDVIIDNVVAYYNDMDKSSSYTLPRFYEYLSKSLDKLSDKLGVKFTIIYEQGKNFSSYKNILAYLNSIKYVNMVNDYFNTVYYLHKIEDTEQAEIFAWDNKKVEYIKTDKVFNLKTLEIKTA